VILFAKAHHAVQIARPVHTLLAVIVMASVNASKDTLVKIVKTRLAVSIVPMGDTVAAMERVFVPTLFFYQIANVKHVVMNVFKVLDLKVALATGLAFAPMGTMEGHARKSTAVKNV
jgi:hypothetical protein